MKITRTSILSGITRTLDLPIMARDLTLWQQGALIQDALPQLSENEREFVLSGITADEWDMEFADAEEDPS